MVSKYDKFYNSPVPTPDEIGAALRGKPLRSDGTHSKITTAEWTEFLSDPVAARPFWDARFATAHALDCERRSKMLQGLPGEHLPPYDDKRPTAISTIDWAELLADPVTTPRARAFYDASSEGRKKHERS